jgi:hypothetical protein
MPGGTVARDRFRGEATPLGDEDEADKDVVPRGGDRRSRARHQSVKPGAAGGERLSGPAMKLMTSFACCRQRHLV